MTSDKETIFAALWSALNTSLTGIRTSGRRVKHWDECAPQDQPAMFIEQISAKTDGQVNQPGKQTIQAKVLIYCFADDTTGPMPAVNGFVSQIEAALKKPYTSTLGGAVASARATAVEFGGGNLGAQGVGIVTVEMLTVS